MVIEERDLVYPKKGNRKQRNIYYRYYSIQRLRKLGEKRYLLISISRMPGAGLIPPSACSVW